MIGETISHYKILERIGGGGMGVVYKAQDTRLDRVVALKFLPPELTRDSEARERFVHEAKAASSLQHHNICTIHDIDQTADGQMFIVMDLYEGETLKSRIAKGQSRPEQSRGMRIEEATDIAIQIAQGLAEAHEHGIVHRDVLITKGGVAKVVDFGLAKLSGASKVTKTGSTLGTVAYMAPEQLQGSDVDTRADIFSVGVVLYEMLTGKLPFRGDHEAALMYSITNEEPEPLQKHIPDVTSELIHIVSRALEKDPASRYKTMDDLLIDLMRVRKETSKVSMPAFGKRKSRLFTPRRFLVTASVVVLAGVAIALFLLNQPRKLPRLNPNRTVKQLSLPVTHVYYCSLTHDGKWIAFAGADENGKWDIYYMNSSEGGVKRVTYDSTLLQAYVTDCSRDGAWILYDRYMRGKLEIAIVPSLNGRARALAGGTAARFLPMSDKVLYLRGTPWSQEPSESGKTEMCSITRDGGDKQVVFIDPGNYHKGGNITYSYSVSPDGKSIAWVKTFLDFSQDIITYNLETKTEAQVTFTRTLKDELCWTNDNYLIFSSYQNGNFDLWMCPAEGGTPQQLTVSRLDEMQGLLSDDGSKLLYFEQNFSGNIKKMDLQTGKITSITSGDQNRVGLCVSPDNRFVAYTAVPSYAIWPTLRGIKIIDTKAEYPERTICSEEIVSKNKTWSPDGNWIAYARTPDSIDGTTKICVVSPVGGSPSRIVAEAKGSPDQDIALRWVNQNTLSWFSETRTWMSTVETPNPVQFFEDSTDARMIQGGKFVLYRDYRAGRLGWWLDTSPLEAKGSKRTPRKILEAVTAIIAPGGEFLLYSPEAHELHRVSLPDGKESQLPYRNPLDFEYNGLITQDGKAALTIESVSNSKLMLWENPFIKE
jgi:serine/threonine protein kinase/Tol biopolymer transport system component